MRILIGALALSLAALGIAGWRLKVAWEDVALARTEALQALQASGEQRRQAELVLGRLESLDTALTSLQAGAAANTALLGQTLQGIGNIQPVEGDTADALKCLDVRVPGQLADRVR